MARGRSVEGIDFSDEQSRAVFLIGVPNLNT
jgi:Rad3-related DNA helicase